MVALRLPRRVGTLGVASFLALACGSRDVQRAEGRTSGASDADCAYGKTCRAMGGLSPKIGPAGSLPPPGNPNPCGSSCSSSAQCGPGQRCGSSSGACGSLCIDDC